MKKITYVFALLFILASCSFKDVNYKGFAGVEGVKFDNKELVFTLKIVVENQNGFNLKLKPSHVDVLFEDHKIADLFRENKIKFKRKSENTYAVNLRAKLADGALFSLMKIRPNNKIDLRFIGTIKGGAFGLSKRMKIDAKQNLDLSLLKHLKLFN
jgi:LEA14-like dessication related protein